MQRAVSSWQLKCCSIWIYVSGSRFTLEVSEELAVGSEQCVGGQLAVDGFNLLMKLPTASYKSVLHRVQVCTLHNTA